MAFAFNAQRDSDDSDGDLTAWGLSNTAAPAARPTGSAPVVPMMMGSTPVGAQAIRDSLTPGDTVDNGDGARKRQKSMASKSPAAPSFGFNAINAPPQRASGASSAYNVQSDASPEADTLFVEEEEPRRKGKGRAAATSQESSTMESKLVVQVSRAEADEISDYEDMRAGADRVRHVLSEHSYADGTLLYKVQFADFHDEHVCHLRWLIHLLQNSFTYIFQLLANHSTLWLRCCSLVALIRPTRNHIIALNALQCTKLMSNICISSSICLHIEPGPISSDIFSRR